MRRYGAPLIGLLVALLLLAVWWFLLYQPKSDEQAMLEQETQDLLGQQQQLRNEITRLEEIRDNQVEIRAQLARLEEFIPSGPAQPAAIRQFQLAADAAGVVIFSVTFDDPVLVEEAPPTGTPGTALATIPVTMIVEGGYFQVVDLFRRLEVEVPRALLLQSVTVEEGEDRFPELSTTWGGHLFTIVPVAEGEPEPGSDTAEPPEPGAEPGEPTPTETGAAP